MRRKHRKTGGSKAHKHIAGTEPVLVRKELKPYDAPTDNMRDTWKPFLNYRTRERYKDLPFGRLGGREQGDD